MLNITSSVFLNFKWFDFFIVFLCFHLVSEVNGQQPVVMSFERSSEVVEEGREFLVRLKIPDQYEGYEVLWNAPVDWYVNGESAIYKNYHNDANVIMEAGSVSGMVTATLYKKGFEEQGSVTFYTYFTVIPSGFAFSGNLHSEQKEGTDFLR